MSRRSLHIPTYRLHKPSGQARVIIDGKHIYLGNHDSQQSRERYDRIISEWLSRGRTKSSPGCGVNGLPTHGLTINQLILAYVQFARSYYIKRGEPTGELDNIRDALRPLRRLYGSSAATEFGPDELIAVRAAMIYSGLSRSVINSRVARIRRMFRWATTKKRNVSLVAPGIYHELLARIVKVFED